MRQQGIIWFSILLMGVALPLSAQEITLEGDGADDTEALQTFLLRYIQNSGPFMLADVQPPTIAVGSVPSDFPLALPVPEGAIVVGGLTNQHEYGFSQVLLSVPQDPSTLFDFFTDQLPSDFQRVENPQPMGGSGFAPVSVSEMNLFCNLETNQSLAVRVHPSATGNNAVVVDVYPQAQRASCDPEARAGMPPSGAFNLLPTLTAPAGATQRSVGGGGGSDREASTTGTIETQTLDFEALFTHYNDQLDAADWELLSLTETADGGWSHWLVTDEGTGTYLGTLTFLRSPLDDTMYNAVLTLHLQS